jgi:hypothetical protein
MKHKEMVNFVENMETEPGVDEPASLLLVPGMRGEGDALLLDDRVGPPLPDHEGLTVSSSWAILNDDESHISSPHLSPVNSEASLVDGTQSESIAFINDTDTDSVLDNGENTQSNTVLEAADQCTVLEDKGIHLLLHIYTF